MVANVWYPLDYYKLSFGKQDGFKKIAIYISEKIQIDNTPNSKDLFYQLHEKLSTKDLKSLYIEVGNLLRWVPYRFLRPFFKNELKGVKDSEVNSKIEKYSIENSYKVFYEISNNQITLNNEWIKYFKTHQYILRGFINWKLIQFLQKNNPNVIGLSEKLYKPKERDLKKAQVYWSKYISLKKDVKCIYSGNQLKKYSIDHFLPWSYIAHDLLWNLVPINGSANSSKSNSLPDIGKYFNDFVYLQFDAFNTISKSDLKNREIILEDYVQLFNKSSDEIKALSFDQFRQKFQETILPLYQIALNMGFPANWFYDKLQPFNFNSPQTLPIS
jgi:hypothetical protein